MAKKMVAKKVAKKDASSKSSKVSATKSKGKSGAKSVKMTGAGGKAEPVSLVGLQGLRNEMKELSENPKALSAQDAARLAKRAHARLESFLKACAGVGNGQSGTKISVVPSGN